ncbi:ROK family transcriptional regulator [Sinomonas terrae]|uniref:ROK family transcriptional regulator n=1 Tax=Sinomonas terrae TaxID=2908838 RepID=A0ABS9TYM5_9MICC|nr:ROK family transcriptional regulator [Sinomonas terrae]MCH6469549.1 ROK family transcriptional regulator [Sinomonas terrae]
MAIQRRTPGSQTSLREANRARIIDVIKKYGGLTQVELAGATGLSPATVSNIVKELSSSGVLHTTQSIRSGRRAQRVTLAHSLGLVVGVHFSARHMRIALADVANTVVTENHMPLARDHRADNELDRVSLLLTDMLESVEASRDEVLAVGLALPAPYDRGSGTIARRGIMRGWDGVEVADSLARRLRRPVYVDNAANLAALAEARHGAARGKRNAVTLEIGDGIGAGLLLNGQVFRGSHGVAGEFGHFTVRQNGAICRCGNRGCLETVASGPAIIEGLRDHLGSLNLGDVVVQAMTGDARCIRAIAEAGRHIGLAAANLCNLLDPERIVVGGELARAGELLLGPLRHAVERSLIVDEDLMPDIVQAQLGLRGATLGAIAYAIDCIAIDTDLAAPEPVEKA